MSSTDTRIARLHSRPILDSRGRPTVEAELVLANGVMARASVPSGASKGKAEAVELRDSRTNWGGLGVDLAVANVKGEISRLLLGHDALDQSGLDQKMRDADGTPNLARLGGNAILAVSLAAAKAGAAAMTKPLYQRMAELSGVVSGMPMPMVNILSGGLHAGHGMDLQDFLMVPIGATSYPEALEWACRVRSAAAGLCAEQGITTLLADEGGLSPNFESAELALDLMIAAFERAGLSPGQEAAIALDMASSSLLDVNGRYAFRRQKRVFDAVEMIELQKEWVAKYPIISIEDGLGEDDWENWPALTRDLAGIQLVGDDLFATQPDRISRAVGAKIANAVLIKLNQNGTLSGTLEAIETARSAGYATIVSARSGETEDSLIADLAVGTASGQIKIGSVRNSERLSKYNQLLRLDEDGICWSGRTGIAPL